MPRSAKAPLPLEPADQGGVAPAVGALVEGTELAAELRTGSIGTTLTNGAKTTTTTATAGAAIKRSGGPSDAKRS